MSEADFGDIDDLAAKDNDVHFFLVMARNVLEKYGAFLVMRMIASVLAPYKRKVFSYSLKVKEYRGFKFVEVPSALVGKDGDLPHEASRALDHAILWQHEGKLVYLTSEPYYIKKEWLRGLIAHCDEHGIDFQIDAESCYHPGHTVRVLFKKGFVSQYDAMQQMAGERRPRHDQGEQT